MASWNITRASTLQGEITVPGDKSMSHRAVILSSLSNGTCVITGFLNSEDCIATIHAMRAMGVRIEHPDPSTVIVYGAGGKLSAPEGDIDCGNSGTTIRLLSGLLAAQPFRSRLTGDASLSKRPMKRVIDPLTQMGARLHAEGERNAPPLVVEGGELTPIHYHSPVASAQVKSAILLAGLFTKGKTSVTEPELSRNHTERMYGWYQIPVQQDGLTASVHGPILPEARDFRVPGDISSAAFWLVAAAAQPESRLMIRGVGLNPTRTGIIDVLIRMGAHIREFIDEQEGEPYGSLEVSGAPLKGTTIRGKEIPSLIDELPVIAVAAALAEGTTIIADAAELRVKETDRLAAVAQNLRAMGVQVTETDDGMEIYGGTALKGARLESFGDHRIAMAFAVAGLFAEGTTTIDGAECVAVSYPDFRATLETLAPGAIR